LTDTVDNDTLGGPAELATGCGGGCDHGGGMVRGPPDVTMGGGTPIMGRDCDPGILIGGCTCWQVGGGPTIVGGGLTGFMTCGGWAPDDGGGCCQVEIGGCWNKLCYIK
jgi:hypothetical protein